MTYSVINSILTDRFVSALCDTLVHSLWQGLLFAAIAGLIVIATKKFSSAIRYNLLLSVLLLFAVSTVITFVWQFKNAVNTGAVPLTNTIPGNITAAPTYHALAPVENSLVTTLSAYVNAHHNTIVLIWFLVICAKSIQLGVGLYGTYYLRRKNIFDVSSHWQDMVQQLSSLLGVSPAIRLLESGIAKVPMVIGHLKPVILMPIGLLTALSTEEVEAILVHELAHIKRRDYLVNLLQSLMEIIFFFNPAVMWVSQLIKTERENCCDDLALSHSNNKINYIRALVSCEEYQSSVPAYAMGFPGGKNTLLDRVKRLANDTNHSLNLFEKTLLAVCLVVSGLCLSAYAEKDNIKRAVHTVVSVLQHQVEVNETQKQELMKQASLVKDEGDKINKATALLNENTPRLQTLNDTVKIQSLQPLNVQVDPIGALTPIHVRLDPLNPSGPLTGLLRSITISDTVKKIHAKVRMDSVYTNVNVNATVNASVNAYVDGYASPYQPYESKYKPYVSKYKKYDPDTNKLYAKAKYYPVPPVPPTNNLPDELLKAHLITGKSKLIVSLTNEKLVINGIEQTEEAHQLILKKYIKKPGDKVNINLVYNDSNKKTSTTLTNP